MVLFQETVCVRLCRAEQVYLTTHPEPGHYKRLSPLLQQLHEFSFLLELFTTAKCHGWRFAPFGAVPAVIKAFLIISSGTALEEKSRTERRRFISSWDNSL